MEIDFETSEPNNGEIGDVAYEGVFTVAIGTAEDPHLAAADAIMEFRCALQKAKNICEGLAVTENKMGDEASKQYRRVEADFHFTIYKGENFFDADLMQKFRRFIDDLVKLHSGVMVIDPK